MNLAQINFNKNEENGFTYSILSALQASHHGQLSEWPDFSKMDETAHTLENLKYWKLWAGEHLEYLKDRITLFGMPCRKDGIDGSAHILKDRGYIFVFNPWPGEAKWGSIPLNEMIGLESGERFAIAEISTRTAKPLGVYGRGDTLLVSIPAKTALLLEVMPTTAPAQHASVPKDVKAQMAFTK
jgi:hypothetical protein